MCWKHLTTDRDTWPLNSCGISALARDWPTVFIHTYLLKQPIVSLAMSPTGPLLSLEEITLMEENGSFYSILHAKQTLFLSLSFLHFSPGASLYMPLDKSILLTWGCTKCQQTQNLLSLFCPPRLWESRILKPQLSLEKTFRARRTFPDLWRVRFCFFCLSSWFVLRSQGETSEATGPHLSRVCFLSLPLLWMSVFFWPW